MRFSLVISVLGFSFAVIATAVVQPQPDPSLITCENKLQANVGDIIKLIEKKLGAVTSEGLTKADKMKAGFSEVFNDTFGECMKVTHVSIKEAAEFEDLIMKALAASESAIGSNSMEYSTIGEIVTIYRHFYNIYPEDYKKSLGNRNAGTSSSHTKFFDLCNNFSFCIPKQ